MAQESELHIALIEIMLTRVQMETVSSYVCSWIQC